MKQILMIVIFISSLSRISFGQDKIDCEYINAMLYLKTNEFLNNEIKRVFSKTVKIRKKNRFVDFHIHKEIRFLNISIFSDKLKSKVYGIQEDQELLDNVSLYADRYSFESLNNDLLPTVIPPSDSELVLIFSKPINNYLIAIMLDSKFSDDGINLLGPAIVFLFVFDEVGLVKDVVLAYPYID